MKKVIGLFAFFLYLGIGVTQTIDFETTSATLQFQDADVGAITFGDIDNDGDNDFIATGKGGPVLSTLYTNDGSGNFSEVTGAPFVNVFGGTVGFEDLNNDGFLDLLITGSTSAPTRTANLYMNDGIGSFILSAGTPFTPSSSGDFAFGDVDSDGDQDVVITGVNAADSGVFYIVFK